jgi:pyruvate ferredoxin oxidoreductase gamma subunit
MKQSTNEMIKRIRFHGRGGQGMKTASRIVGTASFLEGFFVQDSPLYGAERRGAPMVAFTRLSKEPILERGIIISPDIIMIADETLLGDKSANVFQGTWEGTVTIVNTHYPASHVRDICGIVGEIVTLDITEIVLNVVGEPVLSSAAAAVVCKLTGMITESSLEDAVIKELSSINLKKELIEKNVQASLTCFDRISEVHPKYLKPIKEEKKDEIVKLEYADPRIGTPSVYAKGNTKLKKTGNWRLFRPVIDYEKCSRCRTCFVYCPHSCISIDEEDYPQIDYDNCKGCLTCFYECPKKVISKDREVKAW